MELDLLLVYASSARSKINLDGNELHHLHQSESIRIITNIEPVSCDNITPLGCSMFKISSPNSRKTCIYLTGQKRPKMYTQFFYMELDHIGLSFFNIELIVSYFFPGSMFVLKRVYNKDPERSNSAVRTLHPSMSSELGYHAGCKARPRILLMGYEFMCSSHVGGRSRCPVGIWDFGASQAYGAEI